MDSILAVFDSLFTFPNMFWFFCPVILGIGWKYLRSPRVEVLPHEDNPFKVNFTEAWLRQSDEPNFLLRLKVRNRPLKMFGKEIPIRKPATKCHCWIEFYDDDGRSVCQEAMLARWGRIPSFDTGFDLKFAEAEGDVDPDGKTIIDVVIRFDGQEQCYGVWRHTPYGSRSGFTDELHKAFNEEWRRTDENWRMREGLYKLRVLIISDRKVLKKEYFLLTNIGSVQQFRLEPTPRFKAHDS